jgi:hypothetical protein
MRSTPSRLGYSVCFGFLLILLGGCASSSNGTAALTNDNVKHIQKGVTTRKDIEAMFGPPYMVSMTGGGKRVMNYMFSSSDMHITPLTYVPVVGMFAGGSQTQVESRSLQVILNENNVVEDYEFNDSATNIDRSGGAYAASSTATPVSPQNK